MTVEPGGLFVTLRKLNIDRIFGRVFCSNTVTVPEEIFGSSNGSIDQRFFLTKVPVLNIVVVVDKSASFQERTEVLDFSVSDPHDVITC